MYYRTSTYLSERNNKCAFPLNFLLIIILHVNLDCVEFETLNRLNKSLKIP